jgi:hypothetical protein
MTTMIAHAARDAVTMMTIMIARAGRDAETTMISRKDAILAP